MPMKKVEITAYGAPEEIADCVEAPDVGAPGPGEIVFDVLAFPINPADLSMCRGNYRLRPPLPATPGAECVGRVAAVGIGVGGISGTACKRIADSVADGAVVVSYGAMSGEDLVMSRPALSFRGVSLTGFNLGRGLAKRSPQQVRALYADLAIKLRDGVLKAPIEATYPIEDIQQALTHAQRGGRNGKVLVLPNGRLSAS